MANNNEKKQQLEKAALEKEKFEQQTKQINNQEEFGQEENLDELERNKIHSERTAWH